MKHHASNYQINFPVDSVSLRTLVQCYNFSARSSNSGIPELGEGCRVGILGRLISKVQNNFQFSLGGGGILGKEVPKQF